jgi:hypothetical protein
LPLVEIAIAFQKKRYVNRFKRRYITGFNIKKRESSSIFGIMVWKLSNNETKIQKLATENDAITFVLVDAENS